MYIIPHTQPHICIKQNVVWLRTTYSHQKPTTKDYINSDLIACAVCITHILYNQCSNRLIQYNTLNLA